MRIITSIINSKSYSEEFGFVKWLVTLFIGGAFHSLVLIIFGTSIISLTRDLPAVIPPEKIGTIVMEMSLYGLAIFFTPVLISLIATKFLPEKRIVPPLFISLFTVGVMMLYFAFIPDVSMQERGIGIFMTTIYLIFAGLFQDSISLTIIGRSARESDLIKYSLNVPKPIEFVESVLAKEKYRNHFELEGKIEEIRKGIRLRSKKIATYDSVIEIKENGRSSCVMNIVYFDKGTYFLKTSEELETFADEKIHYLKKILEDSNCSVTDGNPENVEPLVNHIIEDVSGVYAKTGGVSKIGWLKILGFIGVICIALGIMWLGNIIEGSIALIFVLLYLIFDLPKKILTRKK